jgi:hypothetical protein
MATRLSARSLALLSMLRKPCVTYACVRSANPEWRLGGHHSTVKWQNQFQNRGWTAEQIGEAIQSRKQFPAINKQNPANAATRYVHPQTGRSVVVDKITNEVLHVGGDGFQY